MHDRLGGIIKSPTQIKKEPQEAGTSVIRYRYTPCKFYAMGHCIKGEKCDFLHEDKSKRNYILVSDEGSESDTFDDYVPCSVKLDDFQPVPVPENNRNVVLRHTDEEELIE